MKAIVRRNLKVRCVVPCEANPSVTMNVGAPEVTRPAALSPFGPVLRGRYPRLLLPLALCAFVALPTHASLAQNWQTVDDFQFVAGQTAANVGLAVTPSGVLFGSGYGFDAAGVGHGLVMASGDGGSSWSAPLDDFTY